MRLLRATLVALFVVGSEVLATPVAAVAIGCCGDRDRDRIDPLKSEDSFSDDVSRTKRKFKPEDMQAANLVLNRSLEQRQQTASVKQARQASTDDNDGAENEVDEDGSENGPLGEDGKVTLQIPGKLFGNATNLVLAVAKIFGDFLTNTAIRSARFLQLFQPLFGRNLYIQIPRTTTESNEV
ncbi:uncharacterized protein LOC135712296 [Ochlerotatus camptorhynchus]|uniref:uncharacterized protein LOC135712296 n=1 Tax=Ochlerotatus camptorhynchus TaxID=644619 RepID=UPI0031D267F7